MAKALVIVDVQNDFCPGGALAVPEGDAVVGLLNAYARDFAAAGAPVIASRDWHPDVTRHFQPVGIWPVHCVQGSLGAAFYPELALPAETIVVDKGDDPDADGYSAFQAHTAAGEPLLTVLRERGVTDLYVGGLATDYCVKSTVLDALANGLRAVLLVDAARGVNLRPHDSELAIAEMVRHGAGVATRERLIGG